MVGIFENRESGREAKIIHIFITQGYCLLIFGFINNFSWEIKLYNSLFK